MMTQPIRDLFVSQDLVDFNVDGINFKYKPVTAADENAWIMEYMELNGLKYQQNLSKLNECKVRNIIEAEIPKEVINEMIGTDSEWTNLDKEQRWELLGKLKPSIFSKIIKEINMIDSGSPVKKNS